MRNIKTNNAKLTTINKWRMLTLAHRNLIYPSELKKANDA